MTEQRKIEKFGVGNLYPDVHPPEFSFFKKKCIDVALGYNDGFTFTPKFGDFKKTEDIFDYLKKYLEDKELEKLDIRFDTLKTCIYQINPETLELGELLECEGSDVEYFEWNNQTKSFDEVDSNSLSEEEEEYFHWVMIIYIFPPEVSEQVEALMKWIKNIIIQGDYLVT